MKDMLVILTGCRVIRQNRAVSIPGDAIRMACDALLPWKPTTPALLLIKHLNQYLTPFERGMACTWRAGTRTDPVSLMRLPSLGICVGRR